MTLATQATMVMMAVGISYFGVKACQAETFGVCTLQQLPDISHVMGVAPLNKLYAIMLTVYSASKMWEA